MTVSLTANESAFLAAAKLAAEAFGQGGNQFDICALRHYGYTAPDATVAGTLGSLCAKDVMFVIEEEPGCAFIA
jgi:hypothetical protein